MCLALRPTAAATSVCRLSALTKISSGVGTRAAKSCAEATWMAGVQRGPKTPGQRFRAAPRALFFFRLRRAMMRGS